MSIYMSELKDKVKLALKDFSADIDGNDLRFFEGAVRIPIDRKVIPVPELIPFILSNILGFPNLGQGEKIRWQICFKYKNTLCNIAHQKFGINLYYKKLDSEDEEVHADEIILKITKSFRVIEKDILQDFSKKQISQGNITVPNIYHNLDGMYQYFRENAANAFSTGAKDEHKGDGIKSWVSHMNSLLISNRHGFYNTIAMIDAFFSKTEHIFILVLPFIGFNRENDNLLDFIGSRWQDKYKRIFQIEKDSNAKQYYDRLINLKENLRNTFVHGGFEKSGASLFFHLPNVGAIPVNLTKVKDSPHFNFFPIEEEGFKEVCELLDKFEFWLKSGRLAQGIKYIESGLDVPFDDNSISMYKKAMVSDDDFENLIERWSYLSDQNINMDY